MTQKTREIRQSGDVAYVPLTVGYEAVVDAADIAKVAGVLWSAKVVTRRDGSILNVYARTYISEGGKQKSVYMHRLLMGDVDGACDHIDGDGLNNRKANLRAASNAENMRNARRRVDNSSGVKGVSWHTRRAKWRARIKVDSKEISIGYFDDKEAAAAAYAKAAARLHGAFARHA